MPLDASLLQGPLTNPDGTPIDTSGVNTGGLAGSNPLLSLDGSAIGTPQGSGAMRVTPNLQGGQPSSSSATDTLTGGSTYPGTGADGMPAPAGSSGTTSQTMSGAAGSAAKALINPLWEMIARAGLILIGLSLVLLALAAMLWEAKGTRVPVHAVGDA